MQWLYFCLKIKFILKKIYKPKVIEGGNPIEATISKNSTIVKYKESNMICPLQAITKDTLPRTSELQSFSQPEKSNLISCKTCKDCKTR